MESSQSALASAGVRTNLTKTDYGLDAPTVVRNLFLAGLGGVVASAILARTSFPYSHFLGRILGGTGLFLLLETVYMVWSSKFGKMIQRDRLMERLVLRGDETLLDVGCGRGLLLIGAAKKLTTGKAVGIDLWQNEDLSANSPDATKANARAEGVNDRIEIVSGDARHMPFPDDNFDYIISSMALHNIYDPNEREKALKEVFRVLKPGGGFFIQDFRHTKEYAASWKAMGAKDVTISRPLLSLYGARLVSGQKQTL